jgi:hypothetical protein
MVAFELERSSGRIETIDPPEGIGVARLQKPARTDGTV